MAIQMKLGKDNNHIGIDFNDAYWVIENVGFKIENNSILFGFKFNAYANEETCHKTQNLTEVTLLGFGSPINAIHNSILYTFIGLYEASYIFPTGIPVTKDEQLVILYTFIKKELNLVDCVDV